MKLLKPDYIDDDKIKKLVEGYQLNEVDIYEVMKMLSKTIYSFPRLIGKMDEDSCSDFFEYILIRMEKILGAYKKMDCKFMTWFIVVLRRHYFNWYKIQMREETREISILNRHTSEDVNEELVDVLCIHEDAQDAASDYKIEHAIDKLPGKLKIIIKLHYFDFFHERDLLETADLFKQPLSILLNRFHEVKEKLLDKNKINEKLEENVGKAYDKIFFLKEKKNKKAEQHIYDYEIQNKLQKAENDHLKNLNRLQKTYNSLKNQDISYLLDIPTRIIANMLFRGKNKLKEILMESEKIVC